LFKFLGGAEKRHLELTWPCSWCCVRLKNVHGRLLMLVQRCAAIASEVSVVHFGSYFIQFLYPPLLIARHRSCPSLPLKRPNFILYPRCFLSRVETFPPQVLLPSSYPSASPRFPVFLIHFFTFSDFLKLTNRRSSTAATKRASQTARKILLSGNPQHNQPCSSSTTPGSFPSLSNTGGSSKARFFVVVVGGGGGSLKPSYFLTPYERWWKW
jgi:hypothetical protein